MEIRPPIILEYASAPPDRLPRRPWRAAWVAGLCLAVAWAIGASTNAVSGAFSRRYFEDHVGWMYGGSMTLGECVRQGLLESTGSGLVFGLLFTLHYVAATRTRCPIFVVARALGVAGAVALACWAIGGTAGGIWADASPASFLNAFPRSAYVSPHGAFVRWAAVGGSIWGVYVGGVLGLIAACAMLTRWWRRERRTDALLTASAA